VKRLITFGVLVVIYILFIMFVLSPGGGHHSEAMYDVVIGHLTDHPITEVKIFPEDLTIVKPYKALNNLIAHANNTVFKEKVFGIFDMRITKWVMMLWVTMLLCMLIFIPLARSLKKEPNGSRSRWVNFWEASISLIHDDIVEPNFEGKYTKKAMPYFCTVFFFIFFCNYIGLLPGLATPTGNLAVTAGLAVFTLFGILIVGLVKQGPLFILTGIVPHGIPLPIFPLLWLIEIAGILIKPFALMVRLFANMTAGHMVILIFLYLVIMFKSVFVGLPAMAGSLMIFMLELLVAYIQALIFTTLSAMFIGSSMHAH
jgi:F-type H+-transporting ATPase subunit a